MAKSYGADALGMSTTYEGMFLTTASLRNSYVTYTQAEELVNGNVSYQEIEGDLHRWLISVTSVIAGVYIQGEDQVLTIAEAVNCGLLTRGNWFGIT